MKIEILTLFPDMFRGPFDESIIKRAQEKGKVEINILNIRDWASDKHKTVDGRPFGGGAGMVLMIEPIYKALKELKTKDSKTILLSPQGSTYTQEKADNMAKQKHIILVSGHYEGFDERIRDNLINDEISIGSYVLTGGELPAMVVVDSVVRLIPGVLKKEEAVKYESFSQGSNKLEYPQYTRPENYKGWKVPKVLLSGNHGEIEKWRDENSIKNTKKKWPDLSD